MQSSVIHYDRNNLTLSPFFQFGRAHFWVLWLSASPSTHTAWDVKTSYHPPNPSPHISTLSLQPPAWAFVGVQASFPFLRCIFCVTAWIFQSKKKQEIFHINHLPIYLDFEACIFLQSRSDWALLSISRERRKPQQLLEEIHCSLSTGKPCASYEAVPTTELWNQLYLILVPAVMRNYPLCLNFYF